MTLDMHNSNATKMRYKPNPLTERWSSTREVVFSEVRGGQGVARSYSRRFDMSSNTLQNSADDSRLVVYCNSFYFHVGGSNHH